jgi:hypothetical protein
MFLLVALALSSPMLGQDKALYRVRKGEVSFVSDAPMERIAASSSKVMGVLDVRERTFAIRVPMLGFIGFNSPLQREHFNENYMESRKNTHAQFDGRIIEAVDLSRPGTHQVRAKGRFMVHGVANERIIPCEIIVTERGIRIRSVFDVRLADHAIRIPRVVQQKIAAAVKVSVDLLLEHDQP